MQNRNAQVMGGEGGSRCFHIASKPFVMAGVDSGLVDIIIIILIIINHHQSSSLSLSLSSSLSSSSSSSSSSSRKGWEVEQGRTTQNGGVSCRYIKVSLVIETVIETAKMTIVTTHMCKICIQQKAEHFFHLS